MNLGKMAEALEMKRSEFLEMIGLFLETSASDLHQLQSALASGESATAARAAHSIKGAALNLGLTQIYELAGEIEAEALIKRLDQSHRSILNLRQKLDEIGRLLAD